MTAALMLMPTVLSSHEFISGIIRRDSLMIATL
jgi:hypothetical protein